MFTKRYNGMYINGRSGSDACYITDDTRHFTTPSGLTFKITKE